MYAALECDCIDIRGIGRDPRFGMPVDLIVDDIGRFKPDQACFRLGGEGGILIAGRGLLMSNDGRGETTSSTLTLTDAAEQIEFLPQGFDYEPPVPVVIGFDSFDQLLAHLGR